MKKISLKEARETAIKIMEDAEKERSFDPETNENLGIFDDYRIYNAETDQDFFVISASELSKKIRKIKEKERKKFEEELLGCLI